MPPSLPSHLAPLAQPLAHLRRINAHNVQTMRTSSLAELSGSLGDMGTLLPLLVALTVARSIYLVPTLLFAGAANIMTGVMFGMPLPVQPMKAIAAVAIAKSYSVEETMASGLSVAIGIGVLTVTGLLGNTVQGIGSEGAAAGRQGDKLSWGLMRWVPVPVVKGIQVGTGLSLCISAGEKMLGPLGWRGNWWGDGIGWAVGAAIILLVSDLGQTKFGVSRVPAALIIFVAGLTLATVRIRHSPNGSLLEFPSGHLETQSSEHVPSWPSSQAFSVTLSTALGQLPLTTLNSILAVTHLADDLYPSGFPPPPSPGALGLSISAMNLFGCIFGAMPTCHGSGGLAGQYKFGARSGASIIFLGLFKFVLGIVAVTSSDAGRIMVRLLEVFPKGLLGVLVIAAGVELAKVGATVNDGARDLWEEVDVDADADGGNSETLIERLSATHGKKRRHRFLSEQERRMRFTIMIVTIATLLAFKNDGIGFVAGMIWHWTSKIPSFLERRRAEQQRLSNNPSEEESTGLLT